MTSRKTIGALALPMALMAQTPCALAEQQLVANELPPVVVEGATIEVKPRSTPKAAPTSQPVADDDEQPTPKKSAKKVKEGKGSKSDAAAAGDAPQTPEGGGTSGATGPATAANGSASNSGQSAGGETINGLPAEKVGTSVSVVTAADMKAQQIRNAADALRSLPGVEVSQTGTPANLTVVRIRGAESQHTLVLIDGVEVNGNNTNGFFDFANLTSEEIERIEVLRGPQSGLYGTGAIGGVVNIITKSGKGPLTVRAFGEGGSFGTVSGGASISGGNDRAYGSLTYQNRRTDGFDISPLGHERDGSSLSSIAFRGGVAVFDNLHLDGSLRFSHLHADRDGFDGSASINGLAVANDDASRLTQELWTGRIAATLDTFDKYWTHQIDATRASSINTDFDATYKSFLKAQAEAITYGYTSTLKIDGFGTPTRHFLTARIENRDEYFEEPTFDTLERSRNRQSVIGEARGEYWESLFLTGTVRQDWNEFFGDFATWHTSASLKIPGTTVRLHSSAGTGIKYPSFSEQYGFFFGYTPNPDLKPEQSTGWDGGVEIGFLQGAALLDVTYFDQNLENEITTKFLPNFQSTAINLTGESHRRGVEVSARYVVMPGLVVGGAYTYLDATDDKKVQEIRRPPHSGKIDVNYAFLGGKANVNLAAIYNGDMTDVAFDATSFALHTVTLDEYWLVRLAGSYKIAPGVELYGRIENLLDQRYQEVFGYNTAGVAAYAGLRISYEEPQVTFGTAR